MKSAGASAKCDNFKLGVRTRVRAYLNLDVRGACDPKNGRNSHLANFTDILIDDIIMIDWDKFIWAMPITIS